MEHSGALEVSHMFSQHCHPPESSLRGLREGLTRDRTLHQRRGNNWKLPWALSPTSEGLC